VRKRSRCLTGPLASQECRSEIDAAVPGHPCRDGAPREPGIQRRAAASRAARPSGRGPADPIPGNGREPARRPARRWLTRP
jgi:hypothetical protein